MPQKEPQIFRSPPVYASKREAIRAMADYAMQCGVLGEAARSMALLDKTIDPYSLPGPSHGPFDGSSNPRFAPPGEITTHQSPVTLLNLAVQVSLFLSWLPRKRTSSNACLLPEILC